MQYRPFWWALFHPGLTGGLIVVSIFLLLIAVANFLSLVNAAGQQDWTTAGQNFFSTVVYAAPAIGLLRLKNWARLFEIGYSLLMVVLGLYVLLTNNLVLGVIMVVTHGLVGLYLVSKKCRSVFAPPPAENAEPVAIEAEKVEDPR